MQQVGLDVVTGFAAARATQHEHVVVQTALPGIGFDFGMGGEQSFPAVCEAWVARVDFAHEARFHGGVGPGVVPGFGCVFNEGFKFGDFHKILRKGCWRMRNATGVFAHEECGKRGQRSRWRSVRGRNVFPSSRSAAPCRVVLFGHAPRALRPLLRCALRPQWRVASTVRESRGRPNARQRLLRLRNTCRGQ